MLVPIYHYSIFICPAYADTLLPSACVKTFRLFDHLDESKVNEGLFVMQSDYGGSSERSLIYVYDFDPV